MTTLYRNLVKGFVLSIAVWASACSNVSFTPSDALSKESLPDGPQQETFSFNDSNTMAKVDILFVDDNSGSMQAKQEKLGTRLAPFVSSLGNVDWQIAITTTDTSNGKYGLSGSIVQMTGTNTKILTSKVPNYETVFRNSIVRPEMVNCGLECPSDDERPLQALIGAINKRFTDNAGFWRENSDFVVVFLSDEDEKYAGDGLPVEPQVVINSVRAAFPNKPFNAYGILTVPGDSTCYGSVASVSGKYSYFQAELVQLTGGVMGSICENDYSAALQSIGERVRSNSGSVNLRYLPIPESVSMVVSPFDPDLTWTLEGRAIRFNKVPKKGTNIVVRYTPH
ncbi:MAG: hypothetical protein KF799_14155 [Bdellovibrionales bacterium]|nr:hypothetical protein [Bdellovibrionales bacterium]